MEDIRHKISVVLPIYNESVEMVSEALNSIQKQSFSDIEILVILDNPMNYNLIDYMTPIENATLATKKDVDVVPLLKRLGLSDKELKRTILKLSGGQQQRVAIARSLATDVPIILADEPTGNLDEITAAEITQILQETAHKLNKCVIIVTHSKDVAQKADAVLELKQGILRQVKK